jgi:pimeloyl-ACP methyl ester carboxylesterase
MDVQPFKIQISETVLEDLQQRLGRTRWPSEIPGSGWDYGADLTFVKEMVEYWRTGFNWRAQEEAMNAFDHFRATVDGLSIHFIHQKGKGPDPLPLIITHGWPGTFIEMLKIIPLLTDPAAHGGDPADSFHVVVPSMPGYGFSDRPTKTGMNLAGIAGLWARLMTEGLGYDRFGAQGGDWGAGVTARLGLDHRDQVVGVHLTGVSSALLRPYLGPGARELSQRERAYLEEREQWGRDEGGYYHIQSTKPQTLSYGLNDSPAGLAAWIVDRWRTWGPDETPEERRRYYKMDELLTNIAIYWFSGCISSANSLYHENLNYPSQLGRGERIEVPCGVAIFAQDQSHPPREWAERSCNVTRWTEMPSGGHFSAMEEPELLAEDIRAFFRTVRK